MCGCNKGGSGRPADTYLVTKPNGSTEEFSNKTAADIAVTRTGGKITVKRK